MDDRLPNGQFNKGRVVSLEMKKRISEATRMAMLGLPSEVKERMAEGIAKQASNRKGKARSPEVCRKISISKQLSPWIPTKEQKQKIGDRYYPVGSEHPNWKGGYCGHYPSAYWKIRESVLKRDNYTC